MEIRESFRGWEEWKKNGEEKEESSFEIFMKYMNIDTEVLSDNPICYYGRDGDHT